MAKPILVANWKNYPASPLEARSILKKYSQNREIYKKTHFFVAPPLPYIGDVSEKIKAFGGLCVQNLAGISSGTHTGLVLPDILKSFATKAAIVGHSERRKLGETSEDVAKKVQIALKAGIAPIVCVGEEVQDSDGEYFEFLRGQIKKSLSELKKSDAAKIVIAYEPVWAIGKDAQRPIEPEELSQSILFIKKVLTEMYGRIVASKIAILYGGSVDDSNAEALAAVPGVAGFLVGRASLNAGDFKKIAEALTKKK